VVSNERVMTNRCDTRCPAEALVFVWLDGMELSLCGHHFDTLMVLLFDRGWEVKIDNRPRLRLAEADRK
jgi:hypothetical protein